MDIVSFHVRVCFYFIVRVRVDLGLTVCSIVRVRVHVSVAIFL